MQGAPWIEHRVEYLCQTGHCRLRGVGAWWLAQKCQCNGDNNYGSHEACLGSKAYSTVWRM